MPYDVFMSYSRQDIFAKQHFHQLFTEAGLDVWLDTERIQYGDEWRKKIEHAVANSLCTVFIASPDANTSPYVLEELTLADVHGRMIFPILIRGDELPSGLGKVQYLDARHAALTDEKAKAFVHTVQHFVAQQKNSNLQTVAEPDESWASDSTSTHPSIDGDDLLEVRPIAVGTFHVLERLLERAKNLLTTDQAAGRAALWWFKQETLYTVASVGRYEEAELRTRFVRGQGFAGELWQSEATHPTVSYPRRKTVERMVAEWGVNPHQIEVIRRAGVVVHVPIMRKGKMVGILALDNPKQITNRQLEEDGILESVEELAELIARLSLQRPVASYAIRSLRTLVETARLLVPSGLSARSALYWVVSRQQIAYPIATSESFETAWTKHETHFRRGEGIVGQVWESGHIKWLEWSGDPAPLMQKAWNLNEQQEELLHNTRSTLGAPIRDRAGQVVAVLVIDSPSPLSITQLERHTVLFSELATLASRVLMGS